MVTPESTCLFIQASDGTFQPIVQNRCELCGELVDVLAEDANKGVGIPTPENTHPTDWYISRVWGDSANGYELTHLACAFRAQAE